MFHAQILTLFPEFFDSPLNCSIPKRAIESGLVSVDCIQIRDLPQTSITKWTMPLTAADRAC